MQYTVTFQKNADYFVNKTSDEDQGPSFIHNNPCFYANINVHRH